MKDLQTQIEFRTKEEALQHLTEIGPYWPFQVWFLLEPRALCGAPDVVASTVSEFRKSVADLPDSVFQKAAGHALMWVRGHLGKVHNACEEGDDARTAQVAEWMGYEIAGFVALVNRRYYAHSDLRWLRESDSFPLLPEHYHELVHRLHTARDRATILGAALRLYSGCAALAASRGISIERIEGLDGLDL